MNYLSVIHKEHLKEPYHFGYMVGRTVVWQRLLGCILEELKINPQEIGRIDYLNQVKNPDTLKKMIKNLCGNMTELSELEAEAMVETGMLSFVIIEIWNSLRSFYNENEREEALQYLLGLIQNDVVIGLIKSMDTHFRQHHFRDDPSKNQF